MDATYTHWWGLHVGEIGDPHMPLSLSTAAGSSVTDQNAMDAPVGLSSGPRCEGRRPPSFAQLSHTSATEKWLLHKFPPRFGLCQNVPNPDLGGP
jgi:hypothetical protein